MKDLEAVYEKSQQAKDSVLAYYKRVIKAYTRAVNVQDIINSSLIHIRDRKYKG